MTAKIFGIDLGTTYSCIAHVDEYGKAVIIPNSEGELITPSVVYFESSTNRVVGKEAKNVAVMYPEQIVDMVKRHMGEPHWQFHYEGTDYKAEEISAYILRKVVQDAEQALDCKIEEVVITCPAYFGLNEREATARAGQIAGLKVRSIINEPTAAAIAYSLQGSQQLHEQPDQVTLVYDLGGGTFDITMIEKKGPTLTVIATGGDHHLGGKDWDKAVVDYLAYQWQELSGRSDDLLEDPETKQDLFLKAEAAKQTLTQAEKANVVVTHDGQRQKVALTRQKFDELTSGLLERTMLFTRNMLTEAAKKGYHQFDQILLVGGSTRMPQVKARLMSEFGQEAKSYDPDQSVAKGAAIYGLKLALGEEIEIRKEELQKENPHKSQAQLEKQAAEEVAADFKLPGGVAEQLVKTQTRNVSSRSFGVVAVMGQDSAGEAIFAIRNLILMNTPVPATGQQRFGTIGNNQAEAHIRIMESVVSDEVIELYLGEEKAVAVLTLPAGLPAGSPIEITFELDEQGRLHGVARELSANRVVEVEIETSSIISAEEVTEAIARATHLVVS